MAKKPGSSSKAEFVLFDVTYEDGSQRSNRRVPADGAWGTVAVLDDDEGLNGNILTQRHAPADAVRYTGPLTA